MTNAIQTIITGKLRNAKVSSFQNEKNEAIAYGKIQVEVPDMSGEFIAIQNIKVRNDSFSKLVELQEKHMDKVVALNCSTNTFNNKTSYYFEGLSSSRAS